ncbi:MAG TPA: ABC transporter ATP-binding protein [Caulobacteraceae bacterium]|nr:ABC transporter ATP-binding protein [Caulobacteraceae bacterium]
MISLHDVVVDHPGRRALGPFSFAAAAGEITALVGPSGCGKSTALRLLAGLERASGGRVERAVGPGETALVFQSATLRPWARAIDEVALPLELAGAADARVRAEAALAQVGLSEALACKPAQLSGGMAMRVSLARALATRPRLLLLDEPFAALDAITRKRLIEDVHRLWDQTRPAVVFVTHDVEEAAYLARRVVVMTPGPGRLAGEVAIDAPLPRPAGFRTTAVFREAVDRVERLLEETS